MSRLLPTAAEASLLRFALPLPSLAARFLLAGTGFAVGLTLVALDRSLPFLGLGLTLVLAAHLPLWVHRQTTSPGGATPVHEEVWVPVEEGWLERVDGLERKGARWDLSPWDLTSGRGCLLLLAGLAGVAFCSGALGAFGPGLAPRAAVGAIAVLVPLWLNGIRTTWNPSELLRKGRALAEAKAVLAGEAAGRLDLVPMLALREGRRGRYPVDARLMARPAVDDGSGLLGIQAQVAINSVQGTDYPYLYCVVLGREGFPLPDAATLPPRHGHVRMVYENGHDKEVRFLVCRQYADDHGGWHTRPEDVREITRAALDVLRRAGIPEPGKPSP